MRLWRAKQLAMDLRDQRLSERDKLSYLIAGTILALVPSQSGIAEVYRRPGVLLVAVPFGIINVVGLLRFYRANARGDGQRVVERFALLAVPTWIRMIVLYFAIGILVYLRTGTVPTGRRFTLGSWVAWDALALGVTIWFWAAMMRYVGVGASGSAAAR